MNQTKIKGGCQSGRKVVTHDSKSDLPLVRLPRLFNKTNILTNITQRILEKNSNEMGNPTVLKK